tara:strand:- start:30530 stop:31087 length:558 start_codon:yes stop_codon:yes gene_type:complete
MMTNYQKLRALIIDDDQQDVAGLLYLLDQSEVEYEYVDTLEEGIEAIAEAHEQSDDYDLVICDNHFYDRSLIEYDPNFNGVDLIGIISGNTDFDENPRMRQLAQDYFGPSFGDIQAHYKGRLIMFSGSAASEDSSLFRGVDLIQKFPDREDEICEQDLIHAMQERGFGVEMDFQNLVSFKQAYAY